MAEYIRILLAIIVDYDYIIWEIDVKTTFLNGFIEEGIYMDQLESFISKGERKVCKLQRSIYGLKQAYGRKRGLRVDRVASTEDMASLLINLFHRLLYSTSREDGFEENR
ncbi:UNVERIFIED_CONTAM: Retrovirus-related Pol polyprotein from transposon TNT 1-94 [Sesamum calycinum]|uniref:Retrovirus-related Pol polyprotein from transposon TNT 1-94 n=1 Tax=Sesamum calycinum TaxID=2727403 RepID=A0AAW2K0W6_9LAMI